MVHTKHASNDPRGGPNPDETERTFNQRWFKSWDFEQKWSSEFKERHIISGRDVGKSFPENFSQQMMRPMIALGWMNLGPLPKIVYPNCKPSQLEIYVSKRRMYGIIAREGTLRVTDTIHLRPEFRLFHRYLAYNIIPKAGHYSQVTTMDAFIIYKAAMEEPLNLNYILLKEMADVRNHNTRSLPFGAFLTRIFLHFNINLNNQPSVDIDKGFSKDTVKKAKNLGLEEVQREEDRMDMDTEGNVAIGLIEGATDTSYETDPVNLGQDQNMGYETDTLDDDVHSFFSTRTTYSTHKEYPTQEELVTQEDPIHQGGPPAWFSEYFGKLDQSLKEIKQQ
ncbi:hypothetical protein Acr_00g0021600 [Actinidia rufa]|uniref:Uncharacterized protein n=1 Tax=Actinidia rufa TaxID=165716 RepID=A0A7J0DCH4_9ERIC|nr:hypothetical protein Acr_00g0021600 [Actinidia rufa]